MKSAQDALGRDGRPPLDPVAHGLPPDPADWTDEQTASFGETVVALKLEAQPHPSMLGLPRDMRSWTDGQRALGRAANAAWFDGWEPEGNFVVSCDFKETDDGELVPAENWGEITPMDYPSLPTYSCRPSCARRTVAKIRARARSGLRGGRPSSRRGAASSSRSSSNSCSDSEGESEPGEARPAAFLLAGPDRLLADTFSRLGVIA